MLQLEDFIKETLEQIIEGVSGAQVEAKTNSAVVSPKENLGGSGSIGGTMNNTYGSHVATVEFDVAMTSVEGTKTKGGIGVAVAGLISAGSTGQSNAEAQSIGRVKFRGPLKLPRQGDD